MNHIIRRPFFLCIKTNFRKTILRKAFFGVILLASFSGCALNPFSTIETASEPDPIAEAVRLQTHQANSQDTAQLEEHRFRQNYEIQFGLETGELVRGMDMNDVLSIWGQPRDIETAGDSHSGNQRWTYLDGISERWKIQKSRIVYFEAGHVVGWEIRSR